MQNFTAALLLHPHFHVLVGDGAFHREGSEFAPLPPPDDDEVEKLLRKVASRVLKLTEARYPNGLPYALGREGCAVRRVHPDALAAG